MWRVTAVVFLTLPMAGFAQNQVRCGSELRNRMDEKQLAIQYNASELIATLGPLSYMGARMTVAPKTLQTASAATHLAQMVVCQPDARWRTTRNRSRMRPQRSSSI